MKLACISASQVPSGTANSIQAMKVCQSLAQSGHSVRLWLPGDQPAPWPALAEHYGLVTPFEIGWLPAWRRLRRYDFAWKAIRAAREWGADAVYTWVYQAAWLALLRGLPLLLELHDRPSGRGGPWLFRQVAHHRGRKRFLFITRALKTALENENNLAFRPAETRIAPDGVDLERYQGLPGPDEARRRLGLPEGFTAGYTGHLYPGRGSELLAGLAQGFPQVRFLWVGGRPEDVSYWKNEIARRGLPNIILTGFVANRHIPLYQAAADVLLMPYERVITGSSGGNTADICSPMKMFEYMAAGRAILSSDLPVLREVLNQESALFCPPPPEGLAEWQAAFARLLSDPALRARLAEGALQDVGQYTWQERARHCLEGF